MRVEKIELVGFKSFAEKTVLDLHPGITCIVGPNGCGKSNVVDSFKWVLGEQSAKSLRGDKMMEVVFGGSQSKKPKGMAEVSLTVNGFNGGSPTQVTRRLYRSGESDYMINRTSCRLKDVKDMFLDTGLELKSYAIFEQDNISRIINSKPEERRFLIEEVAGVVKYKVRRGEAEAKLESSRLNLQRLWDIIGEVKRQINSLDRQAKKAERYKRLMEELKGLELRQAKKEYLEGSKTLGAVEAELSALREKDAGGRAQLSELEDGYAQRRIVITDREKAAGALQEQLHALERDMAAKERETAVLDTEKEGLKQNITRLLKAEEDFKDKIAQTGQKIAGLTAEGETLAAAISSFEERLGAMNSGIEISKGAIEELEAAVELARKDLFRVSDELSRHLGEIGKAEMAIAGFKKRELSLAGETESLGQMLAQNEEALKGLEAGAVENANACELAKQEKEALSGEISALRQKAQNLAAEIAKKREALAYARSRADSLREILLPPASKELLGAERPELKISNNLADVIEAAPEYERAIEAALKEFLAGGFIVPDRQDAIAALKTLRGRDIERTSFIPLSINARPDQAPGEDGPLPHGVIGRAADFVKAAPGYEPVVKALLADVLIVKDLEDVFSSGAPSGGKYMCVSLDGEVLEPKGTLSGGKIWGLLAKKRELRELDGEAGRLKAQTAALEDELAATGARTEEKERLLAGAGQRLHELEKEISLLSHSLENGRLEIERLQKKSSYLKLEGESLKGELARMEETLARLQGAKEEQERKKASKEQEISSLQEKLSRAKETFEEERAGLVEQRLELNGLKQGLENLKKEITRLENLKAETASGLSKAESERQDNERAVQEKEARAGGLLAALRETVSRADQVKEDLFEKRHELAEMAEGLTELEKSMKSFRAEIDSLGRLIAENEVRKTQTAMKMENLAAGVKTAYDVEIETYETEIPDEEEAQAEAGQIAELKKKLAELGPVSLATIEEYEELKNRFEFLNTQREDLEKSISELEEAIKKINTSTRKMLREAYDALKAKFSEIFVEFFGGGRAELMLTDEANILETGIEIIAQPPGKKLQNLNLMSGGEKSVTALSLLFASFLIKPTPLCILDEADAALDEANTAKFAEMLRTLSAATQFIVITHNRVTMEAADYIYGVTMQEPGVSKVISMRFAEA